MTTNTMKEPGVGEGQEGKLAKEGGGNPLEQIERLLTCPICLDRYKQPKLLPCQHTFCLPCLDNYVESTGGRPRLRCPECRAEHGLALDGGVHALQTNLTLLAFLEIHMEASAANAAEMQAYVQRFNLERCRVCEEKAELELCAHCERKCCAECRRAHIDMMKRDLGRLLGQVRRLSARVKEASNGMGRGMEQVQANGEQTRQEIRDYFNRYQRELKRREENFLEQADVFVQTEERLMRTLRDALDVEWNNLQDACLWVDAALSGQRQARDEDLARFKLEFQQGLDYLRSFQPDSEELFAKKLRFSPGDDAAKLPTAIANFGELTVSLPQFANRYLPLEQQYLPRPFRMSLESENFMRRDRAAGGGDRFGGQQHREEDAVGGGGGQESAGAQRWRRRRELEEEAWARLRGDGALRVDGAVLATSPWSTAASSRVASGAVSPLPIETANNGAKSPAPIANREGGRQAAMEAMKETAVVEEPKKEPPAKVEKVEQPTEVAERGDKMEERGRGGGGNETTKGENGEEKKEDEEGAQQATTASMPAAQPARGPAAGPLSASSSAANNKATGRPPGGLAIQQKGKVAAGSGIPTSTQQIGGPKNGQAEGPPATRGRLLMVNGPRAGAAGTTSTATGGAPRRSGTHKTHHQHPNNLMHHPNPHNPHSQIVALHPKGQKPPLPARQLSANDKTATASGNGRAASNSQKRVKNQRNSEEEKEEEEEEEDGKGQREEAEEGEGAGPRGRQLQIQSQSKRFRIQCRSSSHGRPKHRPSIETGQPIPVAFFPIKSTGDWPDQQPAPLLLSRSRTNPDLAAEFAVAQSPILGRRRQSRGGEAAAADSTALVGSFDYEGMRPRPRLVLGDRGTALGQLNWPRGICALPDDQGEGDLFAIADSSNHRVQIFSANGGSLIRSFGTFGTADGQFDGCCVVCLHKSRGELLVADRYNHRVQIVDLKGRFIRKFGCRGTGPGQFQHCWGIAVDEQLGLVYVVDKDNHRVQMFDAEGAFLTTFGSMGDGPGHFNHPLYLAFHSPTRLLYVSDSANNRICTYSPDGLPVRQFQGQGSPDGLLKLPRGIALDEAGCLLVADSGNNRIQVFSPEGQCLRQFGSWGTAPGQFKGVEGLCLLRGHLAVADRENNRAQLFSCSPNSNQTH